MTVGLAASGAQRVQRRLKERIIRRHLRLSHGHASSVVILHELRVQIDTPVPSALPINPNATNDRGNSRHSHSILASKGRAVGEASSDLQGSRADPA